MDDKSRARDSVDVYARRTFEFVENVQGLTSLAAITALVLRELEWFGFHCVSILTLPGPGMHPTSGVLVNTRPQDYAEHYVRKNYFVRDPVVTELRRTLDPFSWSDVRERRDLTRAEKAIMDEGREFGAHDGFIVPIVTEKGALALFSPCGTDPDLSPRARAAIEIIGMYSYQALKRAAKKERGTAANAYMPLTPREREIMQWVAAGKSDDEIAEILAIGETTVTTHVENAKRKLGAFRRPYAVVQALRFGEISL
jgi:LuxR family quorum sensing-dependent transcriptional regulator